MQVAKKCRLRQTRLWFYYYVISVFLRRKVFLHKKYEEEAERELHNWLIWAESTEMEEFKACTTAFHNWSREIINSIVYGYNNGYTEGTNNVIKVIKRNAYGYHKFENLRKRIFLVSSENSHQVAT